MLYGLFHEDIGFAADGGLYPEMIRNRFFQYPEGPKHWSLLKTGSAHAGMSLDADQPMNKSRERSLLLEVSVLNPGDRAGVVNGGLGGIAVKTGAVYKLTVYARRDAEYHGPLVAQVGETGWRRMLRMQARRPRP